MSLAFAQNHARHKKNQLKNTPDKTCSGYLVSPPAPPPSPPPQRQAHAKPQKKTSWIELVKGCLCLGTEPFNKKTMRKTYLSKHSFITTGYAAQTKNPQPATCKPRMRMPWRFTEVYWILQKTGIDCASSRLDR